MRLRDSSTGQFVSFDSYLDRNGEGIIIEGVGKPSNGDEFVPDDEGYDVGDYDSYDFGDEDMYI